MQNSDLEDTQPSHSDPDDGEIRSSDTVPHTPEIQNLERVSEVENSKRPWIRWIISAILILAVVVGLSALGGIQAGNKLNEGDATQIAATEAAIQFELGRQDLADEKCGLARQRFEYIIQYLDPNYPGVTEELAKALLCTNSTATPTLAPTATVVPTPDNRPIEELFSHAQDLLAAENWNDLLLILDSLRQNDLEYMAVQVDGMYYAAFRNRGEARILGGGNLEGGIFDLNRAEQFGPLDARADGYRQWAVLYLTGLSFWEVDWQQAVFYFEQVAPLAPRLWDGAYYTVDRLATAQVEYAPLLIEQGNAYYQEREWCKAYEAYKLASSYAVIEPSDIPNLAPAQEQCEAGG